MTKKEKSLYQAKKAVAICCDGLVGLQCLDILHGIDDYMIIKGYTNDLHRVKINYTAAGGCIYKIIQQALQIKRIFKSIGGSET